MNQLFNLQRWFLVLGEHESRNRKRYLLSLVAIAGLIVGFYSFYILASRRPIHPFLQSLTYFFGLYFSGCLFGSMLFDDLNNGPKGIGALLIPASHFEKLLCQLLFGIVIFFIFYNLVFYLVDIPMVSLSNAWGARWHSSSSEANLPFSPSKITNVFSSREEMMPLPFIENLNAYLFQAFFVVQSAYILGSVYFRKFSFIKTTITLFALFFFLFLYFEIFLSGIMPPNSWYYSLTSWQVHHNQTTDYVLLPGWADELFYFLMGYPFAFIFLAATYFRLKEKQI